MKLSDFSLIGTNEEDLFSHDNDVDWLSDASENVVDLFQRQVLETPEGIACKSGNGHLTYRELNTKSNQLAHYLISIGTGADMPVALYLDRSMEFLVGMLAVFKAGGYYVPVDPQYPKTYARQILIDSAPLVIVSSESNAIDHADSGIPTIAISDNTLSGQNTSNPGIEIKPNQLCYIMYTSGSTGFPKGVMVEHKQIINCLYALWEREPFGENELVAQKTSVSFAISVKELLAGLLKGVPQLFIEGSVVKNIPAFVADLQSHGVSRLYTFPSQLEAMLSYLKTSSVKLDALKYLFISMEPMTQELLDKVRTEMPWAKAWYLFGCTEVNDTTYCDTENYICDSGFVPIGFPIANTRTFVLDRQMRKVPVGTTGELYIESVGLARGYRNQPGLTAERFVPHPFSAKPGQRLYRSGDTVRYLADGSQEFMGREDFEVKIRGHRVDVRHVEKIINSHPQISESIVIGWGQDAASRQLAAYYAVAGTAPPTVNELRRYLGGKLPTFMVPTIYIELKDLPRLPNDKIDRLSLPQPVITTSDAEYMAPRTKTEIAIAAIWGEIIGQGKENGTAMKIGLNDNFFDLGGHSLLATQLISRIRHALNIEVSINVLFEMPVLRDFSAEVERTLAKEPDNVPLAILPADRQQPVPLSYVQQRLWFIHEHMQEQRQSYNMLVIVHLRDDDFSVASMKAAINDLIARHETLRTTFVLQSSDEEPQQLIAESAKPDISFFEIDAAELDRVRAAFAGHVFDLAAGPLIKFSILKLGPDHHVLMMNMHHLISDGWSLNILFRDLHHLYAARLHGTPPQLPDLPIQYADYALWLRQQDLSADLSYWKNALQGYESGLELPYDYSRPANRAWRAGIVHYRYPPELAKAFSAFNQTRNTTLFMGLITSFAVVLNQYTGREDLCIGTTTAGRDHKELEDLIGFFVNILPLRLDLSGNPTVKELYDRTRKVVVQGFEHQALPFEYLLNALHIARDNSLIPLVPVILRHQNFPDMGMGSWTERLSMDELVLNERVTPNELDLQFFSDGSYLEVNVEYAAELFSESAIHRLLESHQQVLATMIEQPDLRIKLIPTLTVEESKIVKRCNDTLREVDFKDGPAARFERQVMAAPEKIACIGVQGLEEATDTGNALPGGVRFVERLLNYGQLNVRANQLAHYLAELGAGSEVKVAVFCDRSPEFLIAMLGVFKAGGCYLPLDPQYPDGYLQQILRDARPQVVVGSSAYLDRLPEGGAKRVSIDLDGKLLFKESAVASQPADNLNRPFNSDNLACLMYTSGSTGEPKGVMVPYSQIINWLEDSWQRAPFKEEEVMLQKTSISFAVSVKELLIGLLVGVPQVILPNEMVKDGKALIDAIEHWKISRLFVVPSHLHSLLDSIDGDRHKLNSLKVVIAAGEPLPQSLCRDFAKILPWVALWNNYGCTELNDTTYCVQEDRARNGIFAPIGTPIANTEVFVLDDALRMVPMGAIGELHVDSIGMARGYWRKPDMTADRFIPNPYVSTPGSRLYKTGDMVRRLGNGSLEFMGRRDYEVKIRGQRVDLRQVEKIVHTHPEIRRALVAGWPGECNDRQLAVYYICRPGVLLSADKLAGYLTDKLPNFMIPTLYTQLETLPCLPNGKLDRLRLPDPDISSSREEYVVPSTEVEKALVRIWSEVLESVVGKPLRISVTDDFFRIGGNSMLAIKLIGAINKHFSSAISVSAIFTCSTIAEMAKLIDNGSVTHSIITPLDVRAEGEPLFCIHPVGGDVFFYQKLARGIGAHLPVYGIQADKNDFPQTLSEMVNRYCDAIQKNWPKVKYRLVGWSSGGLICAAVASELEKRNGQVEYLGLIDTGLIPAEVIVAEERVQLAATLNTLAGLRKERFTNADLTEWQSILKENRWRVEDLLDEENNPAAREYLKAWTKMEITSGVLQFIRSQMTLTCHHLSLLAGYTPGPITVQAHIYKAGEASGGTMTVPDGDREAGIDHYMENPVILTAEGNHYSMMHEPFVQRLGEMILASL